MRGYIVILISLFIIKGCTILENRQSCPCLFSFSAENVCENCKMVRLYLMQSSSDIAAADIEDTVTFRLPKKSDDTASFWYSQSPYEFPAYGEAVSAGDDGIFPKIFGAHIPVYTQKEEEHTEIVFWKRYAEITCHIPHTDGFDTARIVCGNSGYGPHGNILSEDAEFIREIVSHMDTLTFSFTVPEQKEKHLTVFLTGKNSTTIDIGDILADSGYDWNSDNLHDAEIIIRPERENISVNIKDWNEESMEIII